MLCWNVYYGDFNGKEIKVYNIFNHYGFYHDCVKAKKKYKDDKEGFAKEVKGSLHYFFWSKSEWEVIMTHWPSGEYYEMRQDLTIGKLREAMNNVGIDYDVHLRPWAKDDNNITIHVFPNPERFHDRKIDVCEQVMNNWDIFIDWLWEHRKELKART